MNLESQKDGEKFENNGVSVFFGNSKAKHSLEYENIQFGHQMHKADLIEIHESNQQSSNLIQSSDGLHTCKKNLKLGLYTADCIPCFLYNGQRIFSLHLGWRSLHLGLLEKALKFVDKSEEVFIFIGPHIQFSSFEVGNDVLSQFKEILRNTKDQSWYSQVSDKKFNISLQNIIKIKAAGYKTNILSSAIDTYTSDLHCSYRRQAGTKERNISFAFLK